ncbi:MAG TPA: hypothetical protein VJV97_09640 [Gemmatimonadaceae bacterium]|nr:hypothetical protein [Gemmatimonadaceae bacterium]
MLMPVHETLSLWENFYVIVGSSAGALTGLQFVVMALIPNSPTQAGEHEINTFGTPQIVHFGIVLFISAALSAPWPRWTAVATIVWVSGALGIVYTMIVIRRSRRTTLYKPVLEDWIWHTVLPLIAYTLMVVSAGFLVFSTTLGLFGIASSTLLLLFIGIHNAWDSATYIAISVKQGQQGAENTPPPTAKPQ